MGQKKNMLINNFNSVDSTPWLDYFNSSLITRSKNSNGYEPSIFLPFKKITGVD